MAATTVPRAARALPQSAAERLKPLAAVTLDRPRPRRARARADPDAIPSVHSAACGARRDVPQRLVVPIARVLRNRNRQPVAPNVTARRVAPSIALARVLISDSLHTASCGQRRMRPYPRREPGTVVRAARAARARAHAVRGGRRASDSTSSCCWRASKYKVVAAPRASSGRPIVNIPSRMHRRTAANAHRVVVRVSLPDPRGRVTHTSARITHTSG
jgi:hypothetical protein